MKSFALALALALVGCSDDEPAKTTPASDAAVTDSTTPIDTSVEETAPMIDADAAKTCVPDSYHPPHAREAKCTDMELSELHDACLGASGSTAACNAFRAAHLACYSCFLTDANAAAQGALTQWNETAVRYIDVNVGGCLSLLGDDACGRKWDEWNRCAIGACCTVTPFATFQSCVTAARAGACKDLKAAYDACLPAVTNGRMCTPAAHSSPRDLYLYAGKLFCTTT